MIEKIPENKDKVFKTETGEYLTIPELCIPKPVSDKINELVDAVNVLQAQVAILEEHAHPTATTEPADPYAEQRKWIGKLCWFWNNDNEPDTCFGVLTGLFDEADRPFERSIGQQLYRYCEPVKPDDSIIYKGE